MTWQLIVERGQRKGQVIPLTRIPFLIGRGAGCHLRPAAPSVSRRHCQLRTDCGRLVVVACQTTNGTFVNDRRIEREQEVRPGDRLCVGPLEFLIERVAAPPARAPLDEDAVGEMLLAMDEEEDDSRGRNDPVSAPSAATVTEAAAQDTRSDHQAARTQEGHSSRTAPKSTAVSAAGEILGKYVRRPRAGGRFPKA